MNKFNENNNFQGFFAMISQKLFKSNSDFQFLFKITK